jgi:hypothetical protein
MMTTAPDIMQLVNLAVGLVVPLLAAICAVLCFVHRRLSSWLILAAAGFLLVTTVGVVTQLSILALYYLWGEPFGASYGLFFGSMTVGRIVAFALILIGLAPGLGNIARRMRRLEHETGEPRARFGTEDARESWQPRKEGSQDIQK